MRGRTLITILGALFVALGLIVAPAGAQSDEPVVVFPDEPGTFGDEAVVTALLGMTFDNSTMSHGLCSVSPEGTDAICSASVLGSSSVLTVGWDEGRAYEATVRASHWSGGFTMEHVVGEDSSVTTESQQLGALFPNGNAPMFTVPDGWRIGVAGLTCVGIIESVIVQGVTDLCTMNGSAEGMPPTVWAFNNPQGADGPYVMVAGTYAIGGGYAEFAVAGGQLSSEVYHVGSIRGVALGLLQQMSPVSDLNITLDLDSQTLGACVWEELPSFSELLCDPADAFESEVILGSIWGDNEYQTWLESTDRRLSIQAVNGELNENGVYDPDGIFIGPGLPPGGVLDVVANAIVCYDIVEGNFDKVCATTEAANVPTTLWFVDDIDTDEGITSLVGFTDGQGWGFADLEVADGEVLGFGYNASVDLDASPFGVLIEQFMLESSVVDGSVIAPPIPPAMVSS